MKYQYITITAGVLLLFAMYSCNDILQENPTTFASPSSLYKTADDAELVLTGAYDGLQASTLFEQGGLPWRFDIGTDLEIIPPWSGGTRGNYQISAESGSEGGTWEQLYNAIQRTNIVISRVGAMDDGIFDNVQYGDASLNQKDVILGEAHFLRGLLYFYGEMIWGNIPLVLEETTDFDGLPSQATPQEVYDQIIADLKTAESSLPWIRPSGESGHATKGAAKALLGQVYLQMTGFPLNQKDLYQVAADKFKEVIDKGIYGLLDNYGDVFDYQNEDNKEIIFAVKYKGFQLGEGSNIGSFQGVIGPISDGGGYENTYVNYDFAASFDSSDVRFWHNVTNHNTSGDFNEQSPPFWTPWKWHKPRNLWNGSETPFDWPVIRYDNVLLMYAEALNGANTAPPEQAYWAINQIRERARLDDNYASTLVPDWEQAMVKKRLTDHPTDENVLPDLANLTNEEFLTALLQEQAWEMCWECQRKPMLIRTGKLKEYVTEPHYTPQMYNYYPGKLFDESKNYWLPIPQRELDINPNLQQNPGY